MSLLNLTIAEFLAIFGAVSALVIAVYFLDRSRHRIVVPTLRFWNASPRPAETQRRRRIQQPWSLLLQLLAAALLLLAIAQLRWGGLGQPRDHVLILDTSAWSAARQLNGRRALLDASKAAALAWLRALPSSDRVLVIRAAGAPSPIGAFDASREKAEAAIRGSQPEPTALDLRGAIAYARRVQSATGRLAGEVAYAGGLRMREEDESPLAASNLRVLATKGEPQNLGIRGAVVRRSPSNPEMCELLVTVRNYGNARALTRVTALFGGAPVGSSSLDIEPGRERGAEFRYRTRAAGWFEVRLQSSDGFSADNRAVIELPPLKPLRVAVLSRDGRALEPLLNSSPWILATVVAPEQRIKPDEADVVILDGVVPTDLPALPSIWINPAENVSPIAVASVRQNLRLERWSDSHSLAAGLHTRDTTLDEVRVFKPAPDDIVVAETEGGPVIVARGGERKIVAIGFDPIRSAMRFDLATPLLFANILRWMAPETFGTSEIAAGPAGSVSIPLGEQHGSASENIPVSVVTDSGQNVPASVANGAVNFFAGSSDVFRVTVGDRRSVYAATLPEVGLAFWTPPAGAIGGIPSGRSSVGAVRELWQWLAAAAAACLILDWLLFTRVRGRSRPAKTAPPSRRPLRRAS